MADSTLVQVNTGSEDLHEKWLWQSGTRLCNVNILNGIYNRAERSIKPFVIDRKKG